MKVRLAKVKQRRLQREGKTMEDEDSEFFYCNISIDKCGATLVYALHANHPLIWMTNPTK